MRPEKLKAKKYLQDESKLKLFEHRYIQLQRLHHRKALERLLQRIDENKTVLNDKRTTLTDLKSKETSWLQGQIVIHDQLKELNGAEEKSKKDHQDCEKEKAKSEQELKSRRTLSKRLNKEILELKTEIEELSGKTEPNRKSHEKLIEKENRLEEVITEETEEFARAQEEVAAATNEQQNAKKKLESEKKIVDDELHQAEVACDKKKMELATVRQDFDKADRRVRELSDKLEAAQDAIQQQEEEHQNNSARSAEVVREIEELQQRKTLLNRQQTSLQQNLAQKREKINQLRQTHHKEDSIKIRDAAINELLKCKNENLISGIFGRLGDLGAIDRKYVLTVHRDGLNTVLIVLVIKGRLMKFLATYKHKLKVSYRKEYYELFSELTCANPFSKILFRNISKSAFKTTSWTTEISC